MVENENTSGSDVEIFCHLVRERRKARGWTLEDLADEAFGNRSRKGELSLIENGKVSSITRNKVKQIATALAIEPQDVPLGLRWPEALEETSLPTRPRIWGPVPPTDAYFTGRDPEIAQLRCLFERDGRVALTQAAVFGLGGVGKSRLAIEYAHAFREKYALVWWAGAETRTLLVASLADLANQLGTHHTGATTQDELARAGLSSLAENRGPCLLIYDNVPSPDAISDWVPPKNVNLLITTRFSDWGGFAHPVNVDVLSDIDAIAFLEKRAHRKDKRGAAALADALGYLPLALDHAATYCYRTGLTFLEYAAKVTALIENVPRGSNYPRSVAATFALSIATADDHAPGARKLMNSLSYLAPEPVPLQLVRSLVDDGTELDEIAALTEASLLRHVSIYSGNAAVIAHRLVLMVARITDSYDVDKVISSLRKEFPSDSYTNPQSWKICQSLIPHVQSVAKYFDPNESSVVFEAGSLFDSAGTYMDRRGAYGDALDLFHLSVKIGEQHLGRRHTKVVEWINNLAGLLYQIRELEKAEELLREVASAKAKEVGEEHPKYAVAINNLAGMLREQGKYNEAEDLYRKVIEIESNTIGEEHEDFAITISNLAGLYRKTGNNEESERLYRQSIIIFENSIGPNHPNTGVVYRHLADLLLLCGRNEEAEGPARAAFETHNMHFEKGHHK